MGERIRFHPLFSRLPNKEINLDYIIYWTCQIFWDTLMIKYSLTARQQEILKSLGKKISETLWLDVVILQEQKTDYEHMQEHDHCFGALVNKLCNSSLKKSKTMVGKGE